ncbi:uncharacterized protein [Nicotiana tomentosiformis]|uniref:uncharacterized protein n=1 Tax=Nicotiana tomentosiformis TaxID=4098 RepID=UPI00388CC1B4
MVAFAQATETRKLKNRMEREGRSNARSTDNFGGSSGGGGGKSAFGGGSLGPSKSFAQSSVGAQTSGPNQQQWSRFRSSQGNKGSYQQGRSGGRFQQQRRPPCPRCGKMHFGACFMDQLICYGCGMRGYIQRDCHLSDQNMGRGVAQPASFAVTTSATPPPSRGTPTPAGRGAARGGAQSLGGPSCFYAISGRQSSKASQDVVTCILTVQSHDVYALIDPDSTLAYLTPYVVVEFGIESEQIYEPFSVSTPVGEYIVAAQVYRDCVITLRGQDTMADLIELGIVDFDVIMGIDWLYSCFAKLDCRTRTVRFEIPNELVIEGKGDYVVPKGRFISYLKSTKMINKGVFTIWFGLRTLTLRHLHLSLYQL